jgi:hypothetical protein
MEGDAADLFARLPFIEGCAIESTRSRGQVRCFGVGPAAISDAQGGGFEWVAAGWLEGHRIAVEKVDKAKRIDGAVTGQDSSGRGPMTGDAPDYEALYSSHCQGDFYGADYYKPPVSDIESSIIYDDNEDKRVTAAMLVAAFGPIRALEAGCATGLLVKALRGSGVDAGGFDFSRWCVENAHPTIKGSVVWGDILDLGQTALIPPYDLVLCLDILEHLPPDKVPAALANLTALMAPDAILFAVIPAYGPNAFGAELYPLKYDEWRRDAAAGIPFRNIPLDDRGRPHLGHLTHATIDWWEKTMRAAGLERLGQVERLLHLRFDDRLEFARRSFFVFALAGKKQEDGKISFLRRLPFSADPVRTLEKRLVRRISAVPGLPRGFYEWELWGDRWVRWTGSDAWDLIETRGRAELHLQAICHHPDIATSPVLADFQIEGGPVLTVEFRDHDWHEITIELSRKFRGHDPNSREFRRVPEFPFCGLRLTCSRTWVPDPTVPPARRRSLGVGIWLA